MTERQTSRLWGDRADRQNIGYNRPWASHEWSYYIELARLRYGAMTDNTRPTAINLPGATAGRGSE